MIMRHIGFVVVVFAVACGGRTPGPAVQRLLDGYAPGLPLGQRVPEEAPKRYRLQVAANEGYSDRDYQGPDGVRLLTIHVDRMPREGSDPKVSTRARIETVSLESPNAAATARIDQRIREVLGAPTIACFTAPRGYRVESRYWPAENGRGILLHVFPDSLPSSGMGSYGLGWAIVTFGAGPMTSEQVTLETCR